MQQDSSQERRADEYDLFRRQLDTLKPLDEYNAIQVAWAQKRELIAEFHRLHSHLKSRVGPIDIFLRPIVTGGLDLVMRIPPAVTKRELKNATDEAYSWRECLTSFMSKCRVLEKAGIELARLTKLKNRKWHFWHAQPLLTSNELNRRLEALVRDELWTEALELLAEFKIKDARHWLQRIHRQGLENHTARKNKLTRIIGPFTPKVIENIYKAWHKRQHVDTQSDPTKVSKLSR